MTGVIDSMRQLDDSSACKRRIARLIETYRAMRLARCIDEIETDLVRRGAAFFNVASTGHEGLAVLAHFLTDQDWLHLHYRDKALMLARGVQPEAILNTLLCNAASHSHGRELTSHISHSALHTLCLIGPVSNNTLQAVGMASVIRDQPGRPLVVCSFGEGTTQQGQVFEAIGEAVRSNAPVLFVIEDNGYAISTRTTGKTFYSLPQRYACPEKFYGLPIHRLDGRNPALCDERLAAIVEEMRECRGPAIVVFRVERLTSHTNADDQRIYRSEDEIRAAWKCGDPVENLARSLMELGVPKNNLAAIDGEARSEAQEAEQSALLHGTPDSCYDAKSPAVRQMAESEVEYCGDASAPRLTMLQAIRGVLRNHLERDPRMTLFGEDIEDPKGDVFGVTRGLGEAFPGRVINSPLSETTIVGTSIGRAIAGDRPVAFIQFADFLPVAYNQIIAEMGRLHWRTNGALKCPLILMVACGAYRPGLGPFHAQTFESVMAHVPGIDVLMPSNAADAAGLLNAAFRSGRPTIFFYPKTCLNDPDHTTSGDLDRHFVPLGKARIVTEGDDLTIIAWGSTVALSRKVARALAEVGKGVELVDLRSISPWDKKAVIRSASKTRRLLVVHEDNLTCGFGAEVVAATAEAVLHLEAIRRVTRPDTYVPCNFTNQLDVLPSFQRILSVAAEMLDTELTWEMPPGEAAEPMVAIEAFGSSPTDQSVTVLDWKVIVGQKVEANQMLAELEADKSVFDLLSPVAGVVEEILVPDGDKVPIHTHLMMIRPDQRSRFRCQINKEEHGKPILQSIGSRPGGNGRRPVRRLQETVVGLSAAYSVLGSQVCTNDEIVRNFPGRTSNDILKRTGIESRRYAGPDQTSLTMGIEAAEKALRGEKLAANDLDAIICCTGTPVTITPSLACRIHHALRQGRKAREIPCYDLFAACSGYLYALQAAFDLIHAQGDAKVLVVTSEVLSRVVNPADFDTAILFGDAATATVVYGPSCRDRMKAVLRRPVTAAKGEDGSVLCVPLPGQGALALDGMTLFGEAVRSMVKALGCACSESRIDINTLDLIVPHQANGRIIDAMRAVIDFPAEKVVNCIRHLGNTSSSSIPVAMSMLNGENKKQRIGLCAFGGGFTSGAAVLEVD